MPFVITPRILGAGQRIELERTIRCAWTETSSNPRMVPLSASREAVARASEEVLATDRDSITRLATRWSTWRDTRTYNGDAVADTSLDGAAFQLHVVNTRPRVIGSATPEQLAALELEYSTLGTPTAIDRVPRILVDGMTVRDLGSLVLALLLRHLRGPGGYLPSMMLGGNTTLVGVAGDIGTFDVVIDPAAPTRANDLRLRGTLALGNEGWPRSLELSGTCARRVTSRFETTTFDGTVSLAATWTYS